ncbi:hypothetical protein D9M69_505830 [compost metagenome]
MLQADSITGLEQCAAKVLQHFGGWQLALVDFQGQQRRQFGKGFEQVENCSPLHRVAQGAPGQAQCQGAAVDHQLVQRGFEHRQVEPSRPAETLDPRQEMPCGNRFALRVEQACEYFVMQHLAGVGALHDGLKVQLHFAMGQGVVDPGAPVVLGVIGCRVTMAQMNPGAFGMLAGLCQRLIKAQENGADRLTGAVGDNAQMGDRHAIAGAGQAQVLQADADIGGQARGTFSIQTRCQQAEFAATVTRRQPGSTLRQLSQALEQFADGSDQRISPLATQALVEAVQVVDSQHQQMAVTALFAHA